MALALFDLDHTLLDGCSTYNWCLFVGEDVLGGDPQHIEMAHAFHGNDKGGGVSYTVEDYQHFTMKIFPDRTAAEIDELVTRYLKTRVERMVHAKGLDVIAEHKKRGDLPVLITATIDVISVPISRLLGIDEVIATVAEKRNGRYTGRVDGTSCYREDKLVHLQRWLDARGLNLDEGAYFYSDSRNDLPLLELVEHPVAVDPDPFLMEHARQRGWSVLSFKSENE